MIKWKQRLYAFLLKRILGPFLDAASQQKLHESIEVSFQEGTFTLNNVGLCTAYLNNKLNDSSISDAGQPAVYIQRAAVQCITIQLSMTEGETSGDATARNGDDETSSVAPPSRNSSLAWRAFNLGSSVSLVAHVDIDGIELVVEPVSKKNGRQQPSKVDHRNNTQNDESDTRSNASPTAEEEVSTKSMLSTYIEAALASLQLSFSLANFCIRICQPAKQEFTTAWVELRIPSFSYQDLKSSSTSSSPPQPTTDTTTSSMASSQRFSRSNSNCRTILEKSVLFQGITVVAGETTISTDLDSDGNHLESSRLVSTMALAEGTGHIALRAVEYQSKSTTKNSSTGGKVQVQQDIQIRLNQQLKVSVDETSLLQVHSVLEGFKTSTISSADLDNTHSGGQGMVADEIESGESSNANDSNNNSSLEEMELYTLDGIMKQYQEARKLAERNEMRGGILVPSNAYEEGSHIGEVDSRTFDIFFDANDKSFSHYASMMKSSIIASQAGTSSSDFVHTKLRLHLLGGGFKLSFRNRNNETQPILGPDEYILVTFNDLDVTTSVSTKRADFTMNVGRFEIDDAQIPYNSRAVDVIQGRRVEIGNLLSFAELAIDDDVVGGGDVLVESSSISVRVGVDIDATTMSKCCDVELNLKPIEMVYRHRTLSNITSLGDALSKYRQPLENQSIEHDRMQNESKIQINSAFCALASLTLTLPVVEERDFAPLYRRCGHFADACNSNRSAIGTLFENLTFEHKRQHVEGCEAPILRVATTLDCHNIICFASSPENTGNSLGRLCHRLDFFAAAGRFEVDPYIPISVAYRENTQGSSESNVGRDTFPSVPALSSFKARQEDEDEDDEIDRVLSEKLQNVNVDSRRALRAKDPQSTMLTEAESCDAVLMVHIPAIVVDLSRIELETILEMIQCVMPKEKNASSPGKPASFPSSSSSIAVSLACDSISFALHNYEIIRDRPRWNSFLLKFDRCRAHTILGNVPTRFFRFLSYEATLYEAQDLVECSELIRAPFPAKDRVRTMMGRASRTERSTTYPLIYRSKLMPAISHGSPSFLLDLIEPVDENERSIFFSVYNVTHRYNPDSSWMERFEALFKNLGQKAGGASPQSGEFEAECQAKAPEVLDSEGAAFLTRVFLSIADCNLDYTSLNHFSTASRSIVSLGDLRLSSNILTPAGAVQAFSLSIGDVSLYLCNTRFPHNYENSLLPGASLILSQEELSVPSHHHKNIQEMGFKTIFTLESLDAIIAKTKSPQQQKRLDKNTLMEPQVTVSLTLGELSFYACKDSFDCFVITIGELQTNMTGLDDEAFEELRRSSSPGETFFDAQSDHGTFKAANETASVGPRTSTSYNVETVAVDARDHFLLDGYDWTTIDPEPGFDGGIPPGEEQVARWYHAPNASPPLSTSSNCNEEQPTHETSSFRIISQHFPLQVVADPLGGGDMGASRFAGTDSVEVGARILLHDMKFKCRLFDGYDWPEYQPKRKRSQRALFVIDESGTEELESSGKLGKEENKSTQQRKSELLGGLLSGAQDNSATFGDLPLPEERMKTFLSQNELRRLSRRTNSYVQFVAEGISLRLDSYCDSSEHRLKSCLDLVVKDFFLSETISSPTPVKMIGEWFNEVEHPRYSTDGLLMFKLVTWKPSKPITEDDKIASEECEVALTLAPMRCILDQRAIKFKRAFFNSGGGGGDDEDSSAVLDDWAAGLHLIPPPFLRAFRVQPVKLKIDYWPQKMDAAALRNGSIVELINLSPLDAMVLTLHAVEIENIVGFGEAAGGLVSHWLGDICATQMHKFLTNARPFEPITNIGGGFTDIFVLPWDAYKNGERVSRALRSSVSSLVGTVAHETLTTSSRITAFLAGEMARATAPPHGHGHGLVNTSTTINSSLPSRPLGTPRGIGDTAGHALESLARGVQTSNYKMIIVPYREYHRSGARGAVKSIVKGLPVAIAAPVSGASEAISYTLLGARNQIRPDIRREEEVTQRGLHYGGL